MKNIVSLVMISISLVTNNGCKKQSLNSTPSDQLPPLTTKGLNNFGCKVNGKILVPHRLFGDQSPFYDCEYTIGYPDYSHVFILEGDDRFSGGGNSVGITLDSINVKTGDTIELGDYIKYGRYGTYSTYSTNSGNDWNIYFTNSSVKGQVVFAYLDEMKQIASGTFWFDAVSGKDTVHVTDGLFDMQYTR